MNFKLQINNTKQAAAAITLDEYIPLQIKIKSSIPSSSTILHIFFRDQKNLTELKIGTTFGEFYSITVIYSNQWMFYNYYFNDSEYSKWQMSSYFIFKYKPETHDQNSSLNIANPCTIQVFLDAILIVLPDGNKGQFIFNQSNNFSVITDEELNVVGFLVKTISSEMRKILLDSANLTKSEF